MYHEKNNRNKWTYKISIQWEGINISHALDLDLPVISTTSKQVHIFLQFKSDTILSLGQLCDDRCDINLNYDTTTTLNINKSIIKGICSHNIKLWEFLLTTTRQKYHSREPNLHMNHDLPAATNPSIITYYHYKCLSPTPTTWIKSTQMGCFISCPVSTMYMVHYHLTKSTTHQFST